MPATSTRSIKELATALCGLRVDPILTENFPWRNFVEDWGRWFGRLLPDEELEQIRTATKLGIPYASKEFVQGLEELLGLSLSPKRRSRNQKVPDLEKTTA